MSSFVLHWRNKFRQESYKVMMLSKRWQNCMFVVYCLFKSACCVKSASSVWYVWTCVWTVFTLVLHHRPLFVCLSKAEMKAGCFFVFYFCKVQKAFVIQICFISLILSKNYTFRSFPISWTWCCMFLWSIN